MDFQEFTSTPEFNRLHPVKKQLIKELVMNNQNSSPEAVLPQILSINRELSKRNLSFTKNETTLLVNILKQNMSPDERQKVDMLMGFFSR